MQIDGPLPKERKGREVLYCAVGSMSNSVVRALFLHASQPASQSDAIKSGMAAPANEGAHT